MNKPLTPETKAKILAMRYGLNFYLLERDSGWSKIDRQGERMLATKAECDLWHALEHANEIIWRHEEIIINRS
jgi:hypothetical protein